LEHEARKIIPVKKIKKLRMYVEFVCKCNERLL
jgi:hypothetical protein